MQIMEAQMNPQKNMCSVKKIMQSYQIFILVNNISCKVKKENLFQDKKEIIFY